MSDASSHARLSRSFATLGAAIVFLVVLGGWLAYDFWRERARTMADMSQVAVRQSQLVASLFGDTFLAADYVLRDILGHVAGDYPRGVAPAGLTALLEAKLSTVPALTDLVLLDADCVFVAVGSRDTHLVGTRSRQRFCALAQHPPGQRLHIQYMPADRSANGKPVVLMSRIVSSPAGRMEGAAMAVVALDYAQQWIEAVRVAEHDVQTILDSDGIVLARNPPLPDIQGTRTAPPSDQPPLDRLTGSSTFTAPSPLDGRRRIVGLTRLERFPFIAVVGIDEARALEGWRQRAWQFGLAYAVLVALSVALLRAHRRAVRQSAEMYHMATTDALTGIANRRQLLALGEQETRRALRYDKPLAVLMIDIDNFKGINDRWGHLGGDRVIRHTADRIRDVLRTVDICGRLGGEEFTVILPETDLHGGVALAERLRQAIAASDGVRADDGQVVRHTASIGVAVLAVDDMHFDAVLQRADQALYRAKEGGRNRTAT